MQWYLLRSLRGLQNPETLIVRSTNIDTTRRQYEQPIFSRRPHQSPSCRDHFRLCSQARDRSSDLPGSSSPLDRHATIRFCALTIWHQRRRQSGANRDDQIRQPVGQVFAERFWFETHTTKIHVDEGIFKVYACHRSGQRIHCETFPTWATNPAVRRDPKCRICFSVVGSPDKADDRQAVTTGCFRQERTASL